MSFLDDSRAYIPLLFSVVVTFLFFIFSIFAKKKQSHLVNICLIIASFIGLSGTVYAALYPSLSVIALTIFLENVFLIPAVITIMRYENNENDIIPDIVDNTDTFTNELANTEDLKDQEDKLYETCYNFISNTTENISDQEGLKKLLDSVNETLCLELSADGCAILTLDDFEDLLHVKSYSGHFPPPYKLPDNVPHTQLRVETSFKYSGFPLKGNIFADIVNSGQAELIENAEIDSRIYENGTEDFLKLGSYIFVPMKVSETVIGVIALSRKYGEPTFTQKEFDKIQILTKFISAAVKTRYAFQEYLEHTELTKEADIAWKVQNNLTKNPLPLIPSLSIGTYYNTVDGVCGDYYDIIPSRKDRISFILGDVAGKGINSLVIMVMIRAIMRLIVNSKNNAGTILEWANRGIEREKDIDHYASLALVNYDSTKNEIEFATAGTTPILHYAAEDGICRRISKESEPIGVEKQVTYENFKLKLESNDIIIIYTDGLVEAVNANGQQYSSNRLCDTIIKNAKKTGKEISSAIKNDIMSFCGETHQYDDQTVMVIKIH